MWIVTAFTYFVNNSFIKYVPGNFEDNYLLVNSTDVLAAMVSGLVYYYFDNPRLLFFTNSAIAALAGACLLFLVDEENPGWTVPLYVSVNRAGIIANFTVLDMAHPNLLPTLFVATSMGISNGMARLVVILAPVIAEAASPIPQALITCLLII